MDKDMEVTIGRTVIFSRQYKPSKIKQVFKTRAVTESGIRISLKDMSVIDEKTGAWKILASISHPEPTKTWNWAAIGFFSNYFQSYEIGGEFTIERDLLHTPKAGDIIRIVEFNGEAFRNRKETNQKADEFATGREMVLECLEKQPNKTTEQWGMPMVTAYGAAKFKILSKTVSDSFDPKSLY